MRTQGVRHWDPVVVTRGWRACQRNRQVQPAAAVGAVALQCVSETARLDLGAPGAGPGADHPGRAVPVASLTVIVATAVCPHPPLLLRELCGAQDTVSELRSACRQAVGALMAARPDTLVVLGGAERTQAWDPTLPVGVRRFGTTTAPDAVVLPQSLAVARRLLDETGWAGALRMQAVAWDADPDVVAGVADTVESAAGDPDGRVALLVLGDGSARRGEKAPGHLDGRAVAFDDEVGRALAEGDAAALTRVDPLLADQLLARGRASFAVLGAIVSRQAVQPRASVLYRDAPYGVMYTVALWHLP